MKVPTSYKRGLVAEEGAVRFLSRRGYNILHQRFKTPAGEIDIIAQEADTLVFVEVKFRQRYEEALETVSLRQQKRILAAAEAFLSLEENAIFLYYHLRFDVIAYSATRLQHLKNAFWSAE
jgi:putative endonuclease